MPRFLIILAYILSITIGSSLTRAAAYLGPIGDSFRCFRISRNAEGHSRWEGLREWPARRTPRPHQHPFSPGLLHMLQIRPFGSGRYVRRSESPDPSRLIRHLRTSCSLAFFALPSPRLETFSGSSKGRRRRRTPPPTRTVLYATDRAPLTAHVRRGTSRRPQKRRARISSSSPFCRCRLHSFLPPLSEGAWA